MSNELKPQLTEDAVRKIEARATQCAELPGVGQFGKDALALIRDWRAMRTREQEAIAAVNYMQEAYDAKRAELTSENAALREQLAETSTAMRDKCVEKVKEIRGEITKASGPHSFGADAATRIISALESLTLDQEEQKQTP